MENLPPQRGQSWPQPIETPPKRAHPSTKKPNATKRDDPCEESSENLDITPKGKEKTDTKERKATSLTAAQVSAPNAEVGATKEASLVALTNAAGTTPTSTTAPNIQPTGRRINKP